jgi:signal peptidase I
MNKFGAYHVGDIVIFKDEKVTIINKIKGNKTNKRNTQGGITTGYKSNPCLYTLSNGYVVRGDKLKKLIIR